MLSKQHQKEWTFKHITRNFGNGTAYCVPTIGYRKTGMREKVRFQNDFWNINFIELLLYLSVSFSVHHGFSVTKNI